ncbi:MAG: DNA alkylation repair protein [Candidatus Kerfeldbacteria bacterium]|jgi:3-methyladenine DNA glycosylase AlkD
MNTYNQLIKELKKLGNKTRALHSQRFFKTGRGEYGEGDIFLGIIMPVQRELTLKYLDLSLVDIQKLINSKIHEHRMVGLLIVTYRFKKANDKEKESLFKFYIKNSKKINNWDLVDVTCHKVVGVYLFDKKRDLLFRWARSNNLWEKRLSIISTAFFISRNDLDDTYKISKILLKDDHDLIHKAVGWMLREAGKRDKQRLVRYLDQYANKMPRTMLRYSIEKFTPKERKYFMNK